MGRPPLRKNLSNLGGSRSDPCPHCGSVPPAPHPHGHPCLQPHPINPPASCRAEGIAANVNRPRNSQHFGTDFRAFNAVAGNDSHQFVHSVASPGRPSPGRPRLATEGLEVEVGGRVSPRHLVLSSSLVWLPKTGESGHWKERLSLA